MNNFLSDKIEIVDIDILKPAEYNPRQASEKQYNDLKKSLQRFGFVEPAIVNKAQNRFNTIIGGHFRIKVAKDLGIKQIPVVYIDIPDIEKEKELNLRLNKNVGEFDYNLLANFDKDFLIDVGFEMDELSFAFGQKELKPIDISMDEDVASGKYNKITCPKCGHEF